MLNIHCKENGEFNIGGGFEGIVIIITNSATFIHET